MIIIHIHKIYIFVKMIIKISLGETCIRFNSGHYLNNYESIP
jgi:hypothetical protein